MLFNSIEFAIFLPLVFVLYWFVVNKNLKIQNLFLIIASYVFYAWWDWRFLSLIIFSSSVDFLVGLQLGKENSPQRRKLFLLTSIIANLGLLAFFKYFNFFVNSFSEAFTFFGFHISVARLSIILPVGISFYTFQTLSYTIDVYRRKLEPTKSIVSFFAFVSFFPQLVAGPIERATNLLHQFFKPRRFNYSQATDGMRQILWGLFAKVVIADNCAPLVNDIFSNYDTYPGSTLAIGAVLFAFQIYGDFSGYSNIAIGTAKLFGFSLMQNFAYPYFSRDIAEFWRRWHISLSTWFRDYVYIPLGGSRTSLEKQIRNVFVIFVVSGFWHGANWTFIAWGFINAVYFLPLLLLKRNRRNTNIVAENRLFPSIYEFIQMSFTFFLSTLAFVFFRSESISDAFSFISHLFSSSLFDLPQVRLTKQISLLLLFVIIEWLQRDKKHALEFKSLLNHRYLRWVIYFSVMLILFVFGNFNKTEFIYFAF